MQEKEPEKKPYSPPQLVVHGDVEVITLGQHCGNVLDRGFPAGTPFSNLTCS